MRWRWKLGVALALTASGSVAARAQSGAGIVLQPGANVQATATAPAVDTPAPIPGQRAILGQVMAQPPEDTLPVPPADSLAPEGDPTESREPAAAAAEGRPEETPLGPTPLSKVGILQNLLFGEDADKSKIKFYGWLDADYTYRSTGHGENNIAPVMNRFGDEALLRQLGLYITRPLDAKELSWGFNIIFFGGADAAFLTPTNGGWRNTDPRFGTMFTDLNMTAHLPILTDGGVDVKAGRQTTVLGPVGALSWQRPFNSSDYAWYNEEEGRFTGVTANWIITKRLSWYNGIEIGGWGSFFDAASKNVDYIGQLVYWLDKDAKKTKVWTTVLTGPTGQVNNGDGNSTTFELGLLQNWSKYLYQIIDTQMVYSKQPIFFAAPPGYQERSYDVYTYLGLHLTCKLDLTTRFEWYKDVDGGGYPGGFGIPHTNYFETTVGLNYHPTKWLEFRPEIRYDHASNPAFGSTLSYENQITISGDVMIKF